MRTTTKLRRNLRKAERNRRPGLEALEPRVTPAILSTFLTTEHVDINIGYQSGTDTWSLGPRDADADPPAQYAPDVALLYAGAPAQTTRPSSSAFDFIGVPAGGTYHRLPQSRDPNLLYLGVAGYGVAASEFDRYNPSTEAKTRVSGSGRWLKLSLAGVNPITPAGQPGTGLFSIWQSGDSGPVVFASNFNDNVSNPDSNGLDTTDGISADDALWIVAGGHIHYNYGFSQPGRYEVTFRASGYLGDDGNNNTPNLAGFDQSEPIAVYFSVVSVGQLEFDAATCSVNENAGNASVTVRRTGGSDGRVTVNYATSNGTATAGSDYTATSGTLAFNDQETSKVITIPILDDTADEANETVNLTLGAPGPSSIHNYVRDIEGDTNDILGGQSTAVLTIVDNDDPANTPLTISDVANQATNEDTPTAAIPFTVGDTETPAASLTVTATSSNTTLAPNANIVLGGSGANRTVTLTPALNQFGTTTIALTVTNAGGLTATDTFVLTVGAGAVNDPPTITDVPNQTTTENTPNSVNFTVGDVETPAGDLVVTATSSNTTLVPNANLVLGGSGANRTLLSTPALNQTGTTTITLTVTDAGGLTATDTFILSVGAVNDPPVAEPDLYLVTPGNALRGNVLFNDSDLDGDPLTALPGAGPTKGTLTLNVDGTFLYTPGATFNGIDSFTYRANNGVPRSALTTVTIRLAGGLEYEAALTNEHVDVGLAYEEDEWDLHVHDEDHDVEYAPNEALLSVGASALTTREGGLAGAEFDFLGVPVGQTFYRLPQVRNPELLFLGIGAEKIEEGTFPGGAGQLRLKAVNGPGHFSPWLSGDTGPVVRMATSDGITTDDFAVFLELGHQDYNWAFTARGRYEVAFEAVAALPDGTEVVSGDVTYYFSVDNLGRVQFAAPTYTVNEGGSVTITVQRVDGSDGPATVHYVGMPGTAGVEDFEPLEGDLTFTDRETAKTITFVARQDNGVEGNETATLNLSVSRHLRP